MPFITCMYGKYALSGSLSGSERERSVRFLCSYFSIGKLGLRTRIASKTVIQVHIVCVPIGDPGAAVAALALIVKLYLDKVAVAGGCVAVNGTIDPGGHLLIDPVIVVPRAVVAGDGLAVVQVPMTRSSGT